MKTLLIKREELLERSKSPKEILPLGGIARLPKVFALHGTTREIAEGIVRGGGFDRAGLERSAQEIKGVGDGFYFYVASGQGFRFGADWEEQVSVNEIRTSFVGAAKAVNYYARFAMGGYVEGSPRYPCVETGIARKGLAALVFSMDIEALGLLRDDLTIEIKGHEVSGPFPKYLPIEELERGSGMIRVLGMVATDVRVSDLLDGMHIEMLQRDDLGSRGPLLRRDGSSVIAGPMARRLYDDKGEVVSVSGPTEFGLARQLSVLSRIQELFTEKAADLLTKDA